MQTYIFPGWGGGGGCKKFIAIAYGVCQRYRLKRGLAEGSAAIFFSFFIIVVI